MAYTYLGARSCAGPRALDPLNHNCNSEQLPERTISLGRQQPPRKGTDGKDPKVALISFCSLSVSILL